MAKRKKIAAFLMIMGVFCINENDVKNCFSEPIGQKEQYSHESQQDTIFTPYIQFAGESFQVLDDSFIEQQDNMGNETENLHRLSKSFDGLPGDWYVSYSYYTGVEGSENETLTNPLWINANGDSSNFHETEQALVSIYGNYDEYYSNPISNTNIPYSCFQWNSVEDEEYSICLVRLEDKEINQIYFEKPGHQIYEKDLENACYEIMRNEMEEETAGNLQVHIENYVRLNPEYVIMIATNDLMMNLSELTAEGSDYVWIEFYTANGEDGKYNAILQYVEGKWELFGEVKETDF